MATLRPFPDGRADCRNPQDRQTSEGREGQEQPRAEASAGQGEPQGRRDLVRRSIRPRLCRLESVGCSSADGDKAQSGRDAPNTAAQILQGPVPRLLPTVPERQAPGLERGLPTLQCSQKG